MDIKRFFDTVNHQFLKTLLRKNIADEKALKIIDTIIDSFKVKSGQLGDIGILLGNATSQLFANIYLHELDDFIKQELRHKLVRTRTKQRMKKRLKDGYEACLQGKINEKDLDQKLQSYLGILSLANQHTLSEALKNA